MIAAAFCAVADLASAPFRTALARSLALTVGILALCGFALEKVVLAVVLLPHAIWLATLIHVLAGLGLAVALLFLVTPVSFVVASFFFDTLADGVETAMAGPLGRGRPLPPAQAAWLGLRFGLLSLGVNALALLLLLVPGVNIVAFFGANAYLLGRGFFELAALRYMPAEAVHELRRHHAPQILLAGCLCAAVATVPILNLATPLFATALLVRVTQPWVRRAPPYSAVV
jgi:CysZ protein